MVTFPPDTDNHEPDEFFYDTPGEAIQHCVHLGPLFFLDTQYYPPLVTIIRGFEQHPGEADEAGYDSIDGAITESMPPDEFMTCTELGIMQVSFVPWNKSTDNWADRSDELDCGQYADFRFTGRIPAR